ncbi:MAG: hypothetical protein QME40_03815 [bacterium]|nr:hypothetical protein [bacterium]
MFKQFIDGRFVVRTLFTNRMDVILLLGLNFTMISPGTNLGTLSKVGEVFWKEGIKDKEIKVNRIESEANILLLYIPFLES